MTDYGLILGERKEDTFYSAPYEKASHIVEYGDGAVIHTTPITPSNYKELKKTLDTRFPVAKKDILGGSKSPDLEGKAHNTIGTGLEIKTLTPEIKR